MRVLLEIQESKVAFVMELLNSFKFVKVKPLSPEKALLLEEIKEAVENMNLVNQGKLEARPAKDLLNEI